ncbi:MAG TPA: efflux RND transporter periplasmic adaptor subunit [Polyangia bacterium]|jgi:membrane fusion protein (multidrug efflux system)|nr:efflux RND transporter periplasmic adaptor subunit [Polyangia bacterium]
MAGIFRKEALDALQSSDQEGALVKLVPGWSRYAYWFILVLVIAGIAYSAAASVTEYASGPAIVRVDKRLDVTTATGGVVIDIGVQSGAHVRQGQMLVRFQTTQETAELDRINRDMQLQTLKFLRDPTDEGAKSALAGLRAAQEQAQSHLKERSVLTPRAGIVTNLRIRPGQMLGPGDVVATIVDEKSAFTVVALVPGQFRPMLKQGLKLRLALEGFPYTYKDVPIEEISNEVIGPNEVRRYLGNELGDTMPVQGSLVLVRARLPDATFKFEGKKLDYYDGIPGHVDIRVRSLRLLVMMFPVFKEILRDG